MLPPGEDFRHLPSRMTVQTYFPDAELTSGVESFLIVRSEEGMVRTMPPNAAPVLVFRFQGVVAEQLPDGERTIPRIAITALSFSPRVVHYHRGSGILVVRLREGGAAALVTAPMDRLAGSSAGLDSVMDPLLVRGVEDRLSNARDDRERIDIVQGFLKSRLPSLPLDPLVGETIRRIRHSRGNVAISELVRGLATNPDTLEKRFRRLVGATPKMFSRIVRFQSFVDGYSARTSLTEAALLAGFYDHAHLVKEFRTFTGQSPTEYFLRPRQW